MKRIRKPAGLLACVAALALVAGPGSALSGPPSPHCKKGQKKCKRSLPGRMTGAGTVFSEYGRSHHVFRNMHCRGARGPDLMVKWEGGNRFEIRRYTATCFDAPGIDPGGPRAGWDTMVGQGTGVLNGQPATVQFKFTDAGEPGRNDRASITIVNAAGDVVFSIDAVIAAGGNHQAHRK